MLYFAYGSNLNKRAMGQRCPAARVVGKFMLPDARLVFRGVCDVIGEQGNQCPGAIWQITPRCEHVLDMYEGCRGENGMYRKVYLPISGAGEERELMLYVMNSTGIMPPSAGYLSVVEEGYRDFGLPLAPLYLAVQASFDEKDKTRVERARLHREGYKPRAKIPAVIPTGTDDRRNKRHHKRSAGK